MNDTQLIGLKEIANKFDFYDKATKKKLQKAIKNAAKPLLEEAKSRAAVSDDGSHGRPKGTLKKDLTIIAEKQRDSEKYVVRVGFKRRKQMKAVDEQGNPYGVFIEYGTSKVPAKPFLSPALENNRDKLESMIIDEIFNEFLKG